MHLEGRHRQNAFGLFYMTLKTIAIVDRRLIGLTFSGNFGSLPGFGKTITLASLQEAEKYDSLKQCLNICLR